MNKRKLRKQEIESFRTEIRGGGTIERLGFFLIDAVVDLEQTTRGLTWVLIVLTVVLIVLAIFRH